jgi:hypothetical protein
MMPTLTIMLGISPYLTYPTIYATITVLNDIIKIGPIYFDIFNAEIRNSWSTIKGKPVYAIDL